MCVLVGTVNRLSTFRIAIYSERQLFFTVKSGLQTTDHTRFQVLKQSEDSSRHERILEQSSSATMLLWNW